MPKWRQYFYARKYVYARKYIYAWKYIGLIQDGNIRNGHNHVGIISHCGYEHVLSSVTRLLADKLNQSVHCLASGLMNFTNLLTIRLITQTSYTLLLLEGSFDCSCLLFFLFWAAATAVAEGVLRPHAIRPASEHASLRAKPEEQHNNQY